MMRKKNVYGVFVFIAAALALATGVAYGAFNVSVRPYDGGFDLRFPKIEPAMGRMSKEVTVEINSDIGKQYRLVQGLIEPLTTIQGQYLPHGAFTIYGIRSSNKFGTLNIEEETSVTPGRQVIYTSNQNGASDSFTLVYSLNASQEFEPGSYSGRISFNLEPVDSSQSPSIALLNVYAELEVQASIEIRSSTGSKNLTLRAGGQGAADNAVTVNIKGNFGKQFRIAQLVEEQPVSAQGNLLNWEAINFIGHEAQKGAALAERTALSGRQQVIYTSIPRGENDNFAIEYNLGDLSQEKSGIYRTQIKYIYENLSSGQTSLIDTISLEIENPQVFDLLVIPEAGGLIQFRDIKPGQPPKTQEVILQVNSNIGKRYQVTQNMLTPLMNREGSVIAEKYFTLTEESIETKGVLKYLNDKVGLREGQIVLFISDDKGSSDKFKVIYELSVPSDTRAGDYSTTFTYSVSEM